MIKPVKSDLKYLYDLKDGKIKTGLGIGCDADDYIRLKKANLCIVCGHDGSGKTLFLFWYFLCHALINNLTFCVWSGENEKGQILRDLIQMYSGKKLKDLSYKQIEYYNKKIEAKFTFINNEKLYKPGELLEIFSNTKADVCLIDPYTGLNRSYDWADNYKFLNECRDFCNKTKKTLFITTHPTTESGRTSMLYPKGSEFEGHLMPPLRSHIEGGKPFLNRADLVLIIHRLSKEKTMKYYTMVNVEKVKDQQSGGQITGLNDSLLFKYLDGFGFSKGFIDVLHKHRELAKESQLITDKEKELFTGNLRLK